MFKAKKNKDRKAELNKTFVADASNKNGLSTFYSVLVEKVYFGRRREQPPEMCFQKLSHTSC